ncbi:MAG: alpha-L-rhamnosidase C-terminal domain-containing protein [Candidatus Acidiferrales bacterium]
MSVKQIDPVGDIASPQLERNVHKPLPEQFIWMPASEIGGPVDSGYFRQKFRIAVRPAVATLYLAGPERLRVYVNGEMLANAERDPKSSLRPLVIAIDVSHNLHAGWNTLAVAATRGNRLAAKIIPRGGGVVAAAILLSGPGWKCNLGAERGWEKPEFNDGAWKAVQALGGIENSVGFMRWNEDAAMYRWPGYDGISPFLAHLPVPIGEVVYGFEGRGKFANFSSLAPQKIDSHTVVVRPKAAPSQTTSSEEFSVTLPNGKLPKEECPYIVLDFLRESTGRLEVVSDSATPMKIEIQYGESQGEAVGGPYLGADELIVPPHARVYGPKSAFRYALVRFLEGPSPLRFASIRLDDIYYPVNYKGSFESSDASLNEIWLTGAYTSHLCMQDDIWDAPKRDRAPWMGDLDVSGLVIDTVFADQFLMRATMDQLIGGAGDPVGVDVNDIPGYSAFWVMGQADYYRHIGDLDYLHANHDQLLHLLDFMAGELDGRNLFANTRKAWPFVDWSPDLNTDSAEARRATQFEFYRAFSEGAWLLREAGDAAAADKYHALAAAMRDSARKVLLDTQTNTFGNRWQTNAMAIYSGVADRGQTTTIWDRVLSHPPGFVITPYYNFYVISAMAQAGRRNEALDWIRKYWGGMNDEGATSFWESFDLSWPKGHRNLQADNTSGYYVSLSHGWSSGPTAWLSEEILGIRPTAAGFREVTIRPDLAGLAWARGAVPTPHGLIKVDYRAGDAFHATINLPAGVVAKASMPSCAVGNSPASVTMNGIRTSGSPAEDGTRLVILLTSEGKYEFVSECNAGPPGKSGSSPSAAQTH